MYATTRILLRVLTLATSLVGLLNGLDDTDGDGLPHVTDGETTERRILVVRLDALGEIMSMERRRDEEKVDVPWACWERA